MARTSWIGAVLHSHCWVEATFIFPLFSGNNIQVGHGWKCEPFIRISHIAWWKVLLLQPQTKVSTIHRPFHSFYKQLVHIFIYIEATLRHRSSLISWSHFLRTTIYRDNCGPSAHYTKRPSRMHLLTNETTMLRSLLVGLEFPFTRDTSMLPRFRRSLIFFACTQSSNSISASENRHTHKFS